MKQLMKNLILAMSMLAGAGALASTNSIWADSVHVAQVAADAAVDHVAHIGCSDAEQDGMTLLLAKGASAPGSMSGALGEARSSMNEIEIAAAGVRYTGVQQEDAAARDALNEISKSRLKVNASLHARLRYCGNGVEKGHG